MSAPTTERPELAHDVLRHARRRSLDAMFVPRSIAVLGASEKPGSVGQALLQNLRNFDGPVYPVNPAHSRIAGLEAYARLGMVPQKVDLAVIATPATTVPAVLRDCAETGVPAAIIISAGFRECGAAGAELEQQCLAEARWGKMRLLGPNCLGLMVPHARLNATFAEGIAQAGSVAFLSQSGALCSAVLDWSVHENVGFSAFVSVGSMLDVGWGDLITYFGDDPRTRSIVCYMESVGDARGFLSAAREVALTKPIIVLKAGRTDAAAKAAASHTGALTGSDPVLDAAFRRAGVLRVNAIGELFNMAELLAKQPRPRGPRLAIVTNAGGPGALATDALAVSGGRLTQLSADTLAALDQLLPPHWSHGNPIDILGDADPERFAKAVELAARDSEADGVLAILTPQAMTDPIATAERLTALAGAGGKPLLASWMGGPRVEAGETILNNASIPTFRDPDLAARAFALMWCYADNLRALYEIPVLGPDEPQAGRSSRVPSRSGRKSARLRPGSCREWTDALITAARAAGRPLLTEVESKQVLAAYGIPTLETRAARTEAEAVRIAQELGFPVVVKLLSETITHKSDVAGVRLDVRNTMAVRHAWKQIELSVREKAGSGHFLGVTVQPMVRQDGYELILGSSIDPQFGPVLLFGAGGRLVEVFEDRALALPPLNATLARRLMEQTKIFSALRGVRGYQAMDLAALDQLLVRFSQLVAEQPWISEIDVNPLWIACRREERLAHASPLAQESEKAGDAASILALDARIVLHPAGTRQEDLPRLAIRPYPVRYVTPWKLRDGAPVVIRPIRPEDEPFMVRFHQTLSERSVYLRYFGPLKLDQRIAHERLSRICFIDYDREMVLVVERRDPNTGQAEILAVGRLSKLHGANEAEFALSVSDQWQGHGLGTELLKRLVQIGREEQLERITATILADNHEMQHVARKAGFSVARIPGENQFRAEWLP